MLPALVQGAHQANGAGEVTVIPTAAISVNGTMYMRVMSVRDWNAPGGWNTNYSALVEIDRQRSDVEDPHRFDASEVTNFNGFNPTVLFEPGRDTLPPVDNGWYGMQMSAFVERDGYCSST